MRLLVSGGGTGGHIYPALALIEDLKKKDPDAEVLYVGTGRGLESRIVPDAGIDFRTIEIQGFKRSLSLENLRTVWLFLKSVHDSRRIIREFRPDVVVGTGGYVCGSVLYAAAKMKIPTVIHEQNSIAGVTNKFLARFVDRICICFDHARNDFPEKDKIVFTGNPRAQQVAGIARTDRVGEFGLDPKKPTVLIFGGSRGARRINESALEAISLFAGQPWQVLFVTGRVHYDKIMASPAAQNLPENVAIAPYVNDMPSILPEISLIVGRAGATSLAEITALGIPSILIPSPYVTHDHQTYNAMSLVEKKAALMIREADLDGKKMFEAIESLENNAELADEMAENARKAGVPDAADRLLAVLESLVKE